MGPVWQKKKIRETEGVRYKIPTRTLFW